MFGKTIKPGVEAFVRVCGRVTVLVDQIRALAVIAEEDGITITNTHALGLDVPDTTFHVRIGKPEDKDQ